MLQSMSISLFLTIDSNARIQYCSSIFFSFFLSSRTHVHSLAYKPNTTLFPNLTLSISHTSIKAFKTAPLSISCRYMLDTNLKFTYEVIMPGNLISQLVFRILTQIQTLDHVPRAQEWGMGLNEPVAMLETPAPF